MAVKFQAMANTYSKIYFHTIIVVRRRENLIGKVWKDELYKYITGIVTAKGQKLMVINGVEDHVHILLGTKTDCKLSDLMRDIKCNSTRFINEKRFTPAKFEWQIGFSAFSVGHTQVDTVVKYILNQEAHHGIKSFRTEYLELLKENEIDFKEEYLFDEIVMY